MAQHQEEAPLTDNPIEGYKKKQCGMIWVGYLIAGLGGVANLYVAITQQNWTTMGEITGSVILLVYVFAAMWTNVEDCEDHLLITYGPLRWLLCGFGKEKVRYGDVLSFEVTRTCSYGAACRCDYHNIKLFNTCSCCCMGGRLCGHTTVQIVVKERPHGEDAVDDTNCCCENICLKACFGENGKYIGKGCCFQPCCNPCNANCCMMNTIYVSTNEPNKLLQLLRTRTQGGAGGGTEEVQALI